MIKSILFTVLFIATGLGGGLARAQDVCSSILGTDRFVAYVEALHTSAVTRESIPLVARRLNQSFMASDVIRSFRGRPGVSHAESDALTHQTMVEFQTIVNLHVRGWFKTRDIHLAQLAAALNSFSVRPISEEALRRTITELCADPEVEATYALAPFVLSNTRNITDFFLLAMNQDTSFSMSFGPREVALVREALQYAQLSVGDRILHLNLKSPSALSALKAYLGQVGATGWTIDPAPKSVRDWASDWNLDLLQGQLADPPTGGGFRLVVALDELVPGVTGRMSAEQQLVALRNLLAPHGIVAMVYDYAQSPEFSIEQARAAGFQILSWNRDRSLSPALIETVYTSARTPFDGRLHAFVMRLGDEGSHTSPFEVRR